MAAARCSGAGLVFVAGKQPWPPVPSTAGAIIVTGREGTTTEERQVGAQLQWTQPAQPAAGLA